MTRETLSTTGESPPPSGPYSGLTFRSAKRFMARQFATRELPFADEDALDLLLGVTGLSRTEYTLRGTDFISEGQLGLLQAAAERRVSGEPVDRILGWRDFYGRRFAIKNVLSPRGDTEVLLLAALDAIQPVPSPQLLDLGTGSGALAVSLLCERNDATATATDTQVDALKTAKQNAHTHKVADRLRLIRSDWFDQIEATDFDAILSNPPYISTEAMRQLETEVAAHDPAIALHGGVDGLDPYRILIPAAGPRLKPDGWLGVEIGFDQGRAVQRLFEKAGFQSVTCRPDPAGRDRIVTGRWPG